MYEDTFGMPLLTKDKYKSLISSISNTGKKINYISKNLIKYNYKKKLKYILIKK